jgi:ketosteroid isomerase-like protein
MKTLIFLLCILFLLLNLKFNSAQTDIEKEKEAMKQTDIEFSDYSKEFGMGAAFLKYIAEDGVLLRPNSYPIEGIEKVRQLFKDSDLSFTLTWSPLFASISQSGDLGYTYGTYDLTGKNEKGEKITRNGTYVSIWRKDKEGKWKFVLDTGNPGLTKNK